MIGTAERIANHRAMLVWAKAPLTREHVTALALDREASAAKLKAKAKAGSARHREQRCAALLSARAFHAIARSCGNGQ